MEDFALLSGINYVGNKAKSGYCDIGDCHYNLGDFRAALRFHQQYLDAVKTAGDRAGEARAYGSLGKDYHSLGRFEKAEECYKEQLCIARKVGYRAEEGRAYENLGNTHGCLRDRIQHSKSSLRIAKELGDVVMEGTAHRNLGKHYLSLRRLEEALEHFSRCLSIAKESRNRAAEGRAYDNLAHVYSAQDKLEQAIEYQNLSLCIAQEQGDDAEQGNAYFGLGCSYESLGSLDEALHCYESSLKKFNAIRDRRQPKDEWKINLRNEYHLVNIALWGILIKQKKIDEALLAAEKGRAEALIDLLESKYRFTRKQEVAPEMPQVPKLPSNTLFLSIGRKEIYFWVILQGNVVHFDKKYVEVDAIECLDWMREDAFKKIGVRAPVKCEDRSLDAIRDEEPATERIEQKSQSTCHDVLRKLYDFVIRPVVHVLQEEDLIIVPDGPLCLAPFPAFVDRKTNKYLCESYRIRVVPSLTSLKLITDLPANYHSAKGVLLVGNPSFKEIKTEKEPLPQLPFAEEEVKEIGQILNTKPITGKAATKEEVLARLGTVGLVHIATHGCMATGEICLAPNPLRPSLVPEEEDYLLTMADVSRVKLKAKLVVLSCCYGGRGEVKAEGVVGIARALLGAGARSVLVSLWAINDEATMEFMKSFYHHLVAGKSASQALNQARECLRMSEEFRD